MPNSWWRASRNRRLPQAKPVGMWLVVMLPLWLVSGDWVTAIRGLAMGHWGPGVTVREVPGV